mgnify:CR=1 FL=1
MNGAGGKFASIILSAAIGDELNGNVAAIQFLRERGSGKEMTASAAGSEEDGTLAQAGCPLTRAGRRGRASFSEMTSRSVIGRFRVRPSAKPMVSAMASSEDPP